MTDEPTPAADQSAAVVVDEAPAEPSALEKIDEPTEDLPTEAEIEAMADPELEPPEPIVVDAVEIEEPVPVETTLPPPAPAEIRSDGVEFDTQDDSEIVIVVDPPEVDEGREGRIAISEAASIACGAVEVAIEALNAGDIGAADEAIYLAFPAAVSATEPAIAELGNGLLDSLVSPDVATELNTFLNACVAAGHGV